MCISLPPLVLMLPGCRKSGNMMCTILRHPTHCILAVINTLHHYVPPHCACHIVPALKINEAKYTQPVEGTAPTSVSTFTKIWALLSDVLFKPLILCSCSCMMLKLFFFLAFRMCWLHHFQQLLFQLCFQTLSLSHKNRLARSDKKTGAKNTSRQRS